MHAVESVGWPEDSVVSANPTVRVGVIAHTSRQPVVAGASVDRIVARATVYDVIATVAIEGIVPIGAGHRAAGVVADPGRQDLQLIGTEYAPIDEGNADDSLAPLVEACDRDRIRSRRNDQVVTGHDQGQIAGAYTGTELEDRPFRLGSAGRSARLFRQVDDVVPEARIEEIEVGTQPGRQRVVTRASVNHIVRALFEQVGADAVQAPGADLVVAGASGHRVGAAATEKPVVTVVAFDLVVALLTMDLIVASPTDQDVVVR